MLEKILSKEVIAPIVIAVSFFVIYKILSRIVKKIAAIKMGHVNDKRKKTIISLINNIIKYTFLLLAILMILNIYGINTSAIVASFGAVSLVAGLALQDILKDFLSGLSIIFENQYAIGDTVTVGGFKGEVISLGLKSTRIKAYTGEVKIISNRNICEVINHTIAFSLAQVDVQVSYEDDIKKVKKVLDELCIRLNKELPDLKEDIKCLGINSLDESGITFRVEAKTTPLKHYAIERILYKEIKLELDKNEITIPYQQVVIRNA